MDTKEETRKPGLLPPADQSVLKPGDEEKDCGDKPELEKKEIEELQAEDPGNQGA